MVRKVFSGKTMLKGHVLIAKKELRVKIMWSTNSRISKGRVI